MYRDSRPNPNRPEKVRASEYPRGVFYKPPRLAQLLAPRKCRWRAGSQISFLEPVLLVPNASLEFHHTTKVVRAINCVRLSAFDMSLCTSSLL